MDVNVNDNENIEDLLISGLRIIQKRDGFRFGTDSVLLWKFAEAKASEEVLDIGTGSGIIPILMSSTCPGAHYTGIEVVPEVAERAARSVRLNDLESVIKIENEDVKAVCSRYNCRSFDVITVNPPYKAANTGLPNSDETEYIARHEVLCSLEDIIKAAGRLLKQGGRFYMVNRPERLCDALELMRKYRLEPRVLTMVQPKKDRAPVMFLVKGVCCGGKNLSVTEPIILEESEAGRNY